MKKNNIEELFNEKYEKITVPEDVFDFEKILSEENLKQKKKSNKIILFTARVAAVLVLVLVAVLVVIHYVDKEDSEVKYQAEENEVPNENVISYKKEIEAEHIPFDYMYKILKDKVYSIKLNKIIEYSVYEKDGVSFPITKVEADVLTSHSTVTMDKVTFWVQGGVWKVSDLKASNFRYNEEEISDLNDDDYILLKYYEKYRIAKPEVGKTYLITLRTENDELYVETNSKYGFKELDIQNNSILLHGGELEKVEMDKYLKK